MKSKSIKVLIFLAILGLFVALSFPSGSRSLAEESSSGPQIEITAPAHTATVSHKVVLGVREKDIPGNPAISRVDFFIDGVYLGTDFERPSEPLWNITKITINGVEETATVTQTKPPFEYLWNTELYRNGDHTIEYRAYDELGRYTSRSTSVTVNNVTPDTVTESFFGRLYKTVSYQAHKFTMKRAGYVDITLSGDNAQAAYFFIRKGDRYRVLWIELKDNPKKARFWAGQGDYIAEVYYYWRPWGSGLPPGGYIAYVLTIDYPGGTSGGTSLLQDVSATPKTFDPSGDNERSSLEKTDVSYTLGGSGRVTVEVRDPSNQLIKRILSEASQEAGTHTISWNGLDSQENIAEEGRYKVILKIKDASGNEIDSASQEVEVKYHLGH